MWRIRGYAGVWIWLGFELIELLQLTYFIMFLSAHTIFARTGCVRDFCCLSCREQHCGQTARKFQGTSVTQAGAIYLDQPHATQLKIIGSGFHVIFVTPHKKRVDGNTS